MVFTSQRFTGETVASNDENGIDSDDKTNENYILGEIAALFRPETEYED